MQSGSHEHGALFGGSCSGTGSRAGGVERRHPVCLEAARLADKAYLEKRVWRSVAAGHFQAAQTGVQRAAAAVDAIVLTSDSPDAAPEGQLLQPGF